ncbi:MAG: hypothetical protein ACHQ51_15060 [Elusimicrobiota bacterium]
MTETEFTRRYPTLRGALAVFADADGPEERTAKWVVEMSSEVPDERRKLAVELLQESRAFLPFLPEEWDALSSAANRSFDSGNDARDWLISIMTVWETILRE